MDVVLAEAVILKIASLHKLEVSRKSFFQGSLEFDCPLNIFSIEEYSAMMNRNFIDALIVDQRQSILQNPVNITNACSDNSCRCSRSYAPEVPRVPKSFR